MTKTFPLVTSRINDYFTTFYDQNFPTRHLPYTPGFILPGHYRKHMLLYKQATRGPTALSPFRGTRQYKQLFYDVQMTSLYDQNFPTGHT